MSLSQAWENEAKLWIEWARKPGHDSFWQFHKDLFFELLPAPDPNRSVLDIGCGEGRVTRCLKELGHSVKSFDSSPTMVEAARAADLDGCYEVCLAQNIPLDSEVADLVVSHMVLHDVDDLSATVMEMARVMKLNAVACIAVVHPINSAGNFANTDSDSEFTIRGTYLDEFKYSDTFERDGLKMNFHSAHRNYEIYSRAFENAGLSIVAIREHKIPESACLDSPSSLRWRRVPMFLHLKVVKHKF